MKCIYLQRGYFGLIKKYQSAPVQIEVAEIKTLNSLQIIKLGQRLFACQSILSCFLWKKSLFIYVFYFIFFFTLFIYFFCVQSFSLHWLLHSVYTVPLARHNVQSLKNMISVHTLEKLLMLWLLVITFDMLLIKFMQTAQLTFNGGTVTEFFAVLFFFQCSEKDRNSPNYPWSVICWDLFLYFLGHFGVKWKCVTQNDRVIPVSVVYRSAV